MEPGSLGLIQRPSGSALRLWQYSADGLCNRETGRRLGAVLPVHVLGIQLAPELMEVAEAWGLPVLEDAAEALGSWRGDSHCGCSEAQVVLASTATN